MIPKSMQTETLEKIHYGHQGSDECKLRAKICFLEWHKQRHRQDSAAMRHPSRTPEVPTCRVPNATWDTSTTMANRSNWYVQPRQAQLLPHCGLLPKIPLHPQIKRILHQYYQANLCWTRSPGTDYQRQWTPFSSQQFKEFAKGWDFEHITSSPKYPQSNDTTERCIQAIKEAMKKPILGNRDIDMCLLYLRSTPKDHVIPPPGELLFNRKLVSNLPTKYTNKNARKV